MVKLPIILTLFILAFTTLTYAKTYIHGFNIYSQWWETYNDDLPRFSKRNDGSKLIDGVLTFTITTNAIENSLYTTTPKPQWPINEYHQSATKLEDKIDSLIIRTTKMNKNNNFIQSRNGGYMRVIDINNNNDINNTGNQQQKDIPINVIDLLPVDKNKNNDVMWKINVNGLNILNNLSTQKEIQIIIPLTLIDYPYSTDPLFPNGCSSIYFTTNNDDVVFVSFDINNIEQSQLSASNNNGYDDNILSLCTTQPKPDEIQYKTRNIWTGRIKQHIYTKITYYQSHIIDRPQDDYWNKEALEQYKLLLLASDKNNNNNKDDILKSIAENEKTCDDIRNDIKTNIFDASYKKILTEYPEYQYNIHQQSYKCQQKVNGGKKKSSISYNTEYTLIVETPYIDDENNENNNKNDENTQNNNTNVIKNNKSKSLYQKMWSNYLSILNDIKDHELNFNYYGILRVGTFDIGEQRILEQCIVNNDDNNNFDSNNKNKNNNKCGNTQLTGCSLCSDYQYCNTNQDCLSRLCGAINNDGNNDNKQQGKQKQQKQCLPSTPQNIFYHQSNNSSVRSSSSISLYLLISIIISFIFIIA